ncbi:condensin subunit SMC4 [Sporobolomyces salmoneus]|uniref:condensin subunit SMC4 n=1 Tax=Sporobolomyces salmoneus TaxID=183962 RepID=UPI00316EB7FB
MPPRRSTRASTTQPQPQPALEPPSPNSLVGKGKKSVRRSTTNKPSSTVSTSTTSTRRSTRSVSAAPSNVTEDSDSGSELSEAEEESESSEEEEEEEQPRPARRSTATGGRKVVNKPTSVPFSRASARGGTRGKSKTPVVQEESESESEQVNDEASEEEEEEEEEVKPTPNPRSSKGKGKAEVELPPSPEITPAPQDSDAEEEEDDGEEEGDSEEEDVPEEDEEVKPVVSKGKGKGKNVRVSIALPTPEPDQSDDEQDEAEEIFVDAQEEEEEEEEPVQTTPRKRSTTTKKKQTPQKKRRIVDSSDPESDSEADQVAEPQAEDPQVQVEEQKLDQQPPVAQPVPVPAQTPPSPPKPEIVKPPPPPPPPTALTASALASIARQAAIDHASISATREKELIGKPRLVIHQLVLENFKSYKGRGVIGPFHKSFSSIVGPNGSGKSNTIDALLFVFGFRASKMRQGKFSELIHNSGPVAGENENGEENDGEGMEWDQEADDSGSEEEVGRKGKGKGGKKGKGKKKETENYSRGGGCDFATVEVWFREVIDLPGSKDDFKVVPNSQLIVARTVKRDNTTKYTVNGKTVTAGEVKSLLLGRGIDLTHNRFLILQGEVESIAQMKPKGVNDSDEGLLEYLEDIIGTAQYKPQIEEALLEVEKLGESRQSQMNRVKLVEKEKGALESRKKDADSYLRDQLELVSLQNQLYQRNAHQAQADKIEVESRAAAAKQELDEELEKQKADREKYTEDQVYYEQQKTECKAVEDEVARIEKDLATLKKTDVQLTEQRKSLSTKIKKLEKSLSEDRHGKSEAENSMRNHGETLEKFGGEKEKLKGELEREQEELGKVMDALRDKIEGFSTQIETEQQALAPWKEQIEEKQNEVKIAQQQLDDLRGKGESVKADIERTQTELEELKESRTTKLAELKDLQKQRKSIATEVSSTRERLQAEKTNEAKYRTKVVDARSKTAEAKASQTARRSAGDVLSAVLKLKEQGRLPGFHGRLGDLGRIDDKYDVAISTAGAGGLDSLVVDSRETAETIFEHLRRYNVGRAQCLALDRFGQVDLSPIATPGETRRLFDLVTPKDPIYAPVFLHTLRNTLVAKTWEEAHSVSSGKVDGRRWRVVTIDGNIAEASGAAQVGGSRPLRGRMSSKIAKDDFSPEQVARFEQEEESANEKLREFLDDHKKVEDELKGLEKQLREIEGEIPKREMDLEANEKDAAEKEELLEELQSHSKPDAGDVKRISQLSKSIEGFEKELDKLRSKASGYEERINKLQAQIEEVGGLKLKSQKAKVSDLQEQIRHNEDRFVKAKTGKAKAEKDLAKLLKNIEGNTAKLEESQAEVAEIVEQLEVNTAEMDPIRETVDSIREALTDKREELQTLKAELDEQEGAIIEFKKLEAKLRATFNDHEKQLKEMNRIFDHWTSKLGELEMPETDQLDDEDDDDEDEENAVRKVRFEDVLRVLEPEEIDSIDGKKLKADIAFLEERLEKNTADLAVLQEYRRRNEEFRKRAEEFEAVSKEWESAKNQVTELRNQRLVQFMKGFGIISNKLKEMYQMITLGGNAELELYDSADPFSEGILFSVMPPKKSWKNISNLSGGEKTLSSLALVFALHVYKPTPLYFMDEIDAALDFRNVSIVANYIKDRTKNAQFIIISLRNNMFELSARLIGIYKVANQTRSVAIDNKELSELKVEDDDDDNEPQPVRAPRSRGELTN